MTAYINPKVAEINAAVQLVTSLQTERDRARRNVETATEWDMSLRCALLIEGSRAELARLEQSLLEARAKLAALTITFLLEGRL
jgi:hypothetical protein